MWSVKQGHHQSATSSSVPVKMYRKCRAHLFYTSILSNAKGAFPVLLLRAGRPGLSDDMTVSRSTTILERLSIGSRLDAVQMNQTRFATSSALCSYQSTKFHLILPLSFTHNQQSIRRIPITASTIIIKNETSLHSTFPQCIVDLPSATDAKCQQWHHHRYGRCQYDSK